MSSAENTLLCFSFDTLQASIQRGGLFAWKLNTNRAKNCQYAVVCQNGGADNGHAKYIVKIEGFTPGTGLEEGRKIILFKEYAELDIPDVWSGTRFPVNYTNLETLKIDVSTLKWKKLQDVGLERALRLSNDAPQDAYEENGISIADAKRLLAKRFNVPESAIQINISV